MNLSAFLVIILIVILFIVCLPIISGVGNFKLGKDRNNVRAQQNEITSKRQKFKNALKKADVLQFELKNNSDDNDGNDTYGKTSSTNNKFEVDSKTGLKRRVIGEFQKSNNDPNEFDFDLNKLIEEDEEEERQEIQNRMNKYKGKEQETYEGLV